MNWKLADSRRNAYTAFITPEQHNCTWEIRNNRIVKFCGRNHLITWVSCKVTILYTETRRDIYCRQCVWDDLYVLSSTASVVGRQKFAAGARRKKKNISFWCFMSYETSGIRISSDPDDVLFERFPGVTRYCKRYANVMTNGTAAVNDDNIWTGHTVLHGIGERAIVLIVCTQTGILYHDVGHTNERTCIVVQKVAFGLTNCTRWTRNQFWPRFGRNVIFVAFVTTALRVRNGTDENRFRYVTSSFRAARGRFC